MDDASILEKLSEILRDVLDDDDIVLRPETAAPDVPGWDSLANVRFILEVERTFKLRFAAAESARLKNVGELVELIKKRG
jgi:acyl carrier protein